MKELLYYVVCGVVLFTVLGVGAALSLYASSAVNDLVGAPWGFIALFSCFGVMYGGWVALAQWAKK